MKEHHGITVYDHENNVEYTSDYMENESEDGEYKNGGFESDGSSDNFEERV